jgi:hypothetical protein
LQDSFSTVETRFSAGDYPRAALECDRIVELNARDPVVLERARNLQRWIPRFAAALDQGTRRYREGNLEAAAAPLVTARSLYQQIGLPGPVGAEIDHQLASAALQAARAALARNQLSVAAENYRQVVALSPSDAQGRQGLEIVYQKAETLYREAYADRERHPRAAAERFQEVMNVLPVGSDTWIRAKAHLESLNAH